MSRIVIHTIVCLQSAFLSFFDESHAFFIQWILNQQLLWARHYVMYIGVIVLGSKRRGIWVLRLIERQALKPLLPACSLWSTDHRLGRFTSSDKRSRPRTEGICWPQYDSRPLGKREVCKQRSPPWPPSHSTQEITQAAAYRKGTSSDLDGDVTSPFLRKTDLRFEVADVAKLCHKPESQYVS